MKKLAKKAFKITVVSAATASLFASSGVAYAFLTGGPDIIPAPASVVDSSVAGGASNTAQQAFDEQQGVVVPVGGLAVDAGIIPAGTVVSSHMIFLNVPDGAPGTADTQTWTFDSPIIGVMSDSGGTREAASNTLLGAVGTTYPGAFGARGMEGGDSYTVVGNSIDVTMVVSQPGDWIRVVTASRVQPPMVEATLPPGGELVVEKEVTTPSIPAVVDVCLLEDETGSFGDDIDNLQGGTTASDIYDDVVAAAPGAQFAVAGFRDYELSPYGSTGDHVYRLLQSMSAAKADWLAGIALLSASGGNDTPEAQYDAIVAAAGPGPTDYEPDAVGPQDDCGWRDPAVTPGVQRVLVVTTDAPFHVPGAGPHTNDQAATIAALNAQNITLVGLTAPGAGGELAALAAATGGSVQPLSSSGDNIADAIIDALEELTTDVWWEAECDAGLSVTLDPDVHLAVPGGTTVGFTETIQVAGDATSGDYHCTVRFIANSYPEEGSVIGIEKIWITVETRRMTGGGSIFDRDGMRVTHGFTLHCDPDAGANNLEINWGKGNNFHLDTLDTVECSDHPARDEGKPVAGFDTMIGTATGSLNGVPGATIRFQLSDDGEPGKGVDIARFDIDDADGDVLTVGNFLDKGNHQAHAE